MVFYTSLLDKARHSLLNLSIVVISYKNKMFKYEIGMTHKSNKY